ncbi:MAG: hypothetical protein ABSB49_05070 [Polyangia bacterium]|jgi:hypothetical protein
MVAELLRSLGRIFALQNSHQPHLAGSSADHRQGLHQARQAIAFQVQSGTNRLGLRPNA